MFEVADNNDWEPVSSEVGYATAPYAEDPRVATPAMQVFLALAAADIHEYHAARKHPHREFSPTQLLELLSSDRLLSAIDGLEIDTASAIAEQSGAGARDGQEQKFYTRAQVSAAIALAGGQLPTPEQEISFVAESSPIYELIASGVVEPTPDGQGILVHIRKGIDLCLASAA